MIDTLSIRNSILRLGFSGKLTSQQNTDEKVSDMLSRINPKKDIVQKENTPYEIPQTWSWVKLSDLYSINPKVEAAESDEAAFIPMEKICPGFTDNFTYEVQSWAKASKNHTKFRDEDVAFAKISPCFENRKSFIARNLPNCIGGGTTELIILRQPEMLPEYTYYLVLDQRFINTGAASYKGTVGQQRVQSDVIKNYLVPVPPFSEQKRIINKVSEAFSILDAIDELQNQYASNQEALKSKLIDAAIQGKVTEQLPEDGTAEEFYKEIQKEKEKLIRDGKIKKEKTLPDITDAEVPFEIPANWKWVRFGNLMRNRDSERIPVSLSDRKKIKKIYDYYGASGVIDKVEEYLFDEKLLLIGEDGANLLSRSTPIAFIANGKYWVNNHAHVLDYYCSDYLDYVMHYINSISLVPYVTGSAQPKLNQDNMNKIPIPLPPLSEMKRIVDFIESITKIADVS